MERLETASRQVVLIDSIGKQDKEAKDMERM